jgi:hypothetical protein
MNERKTLEQIKEKIACGFGFAQMLEKLGLTIESLKEQAENEHRIKAVILDRYKINLDEQTANKTGTESEQKPVETVPEQKPQESEQENTEQKAETEKPAEIHKITLADIKKKPRKNKKK